MEKSKNATNNCAVIMIQNWYTFMCDECDIHQNGEYYSKPIIIALLFSENN